MDGYATYEVSYEKNGRRKREIYKHHQHTRNTQIQEYGGAIMKSFIDDLKLNNDRDESEKIRELYKQNGCANITCRRVK